VRDFQAYPSRTLKGGIFGGQFNLSNNQTLIGALKNVYFPDKTTVYYFVPHFGNDFPFAMFEQRMRLLEGNARLYLEPSKRPFTGG
jgi:hypothetical protein